MTTANKTSYFMADFAHTDSRSSHAHLRGRSLRAHMFTFFKLGDSLIGRGDKAAADYKRVSLFMYRKIPAYRRFKERVSNFVVKTLIAAMGLFLGAALSFHFLS